MRPACCFLAFLGLFLVARPAPLQAAGSVRLLSADDHGVTVRLELPEYRLEAGEEGRSDLLVPDLQAMDVPGRPAIPFATALVALPLGAVAVATLVADGVEEDRAGVRLAIAGRPVFRDDERVGTTPGREPVPAILDGPWPVVPVEVGEPFTWRRQRLVAVSLRPFRYDEASARLWARHGMTVRVDFVGAAPPRAGVPRDDRHFEPVLREAVLNYQQARTWREPARPGRRAAEAGTSLFDRGPGLARAGGFDEDFPEVRVRIDTTGVYEIPYEDLFAAGFPAGIGVDRVSVHRHEFVENTVPPAPPYETPELPIEVDDADGDTFFGPGDRVVVFLQTWAERSRASFAQRAWGDGEVVYVTAVAGNGRRVALRPGWRNVAGLTPPASFPWTQHWERDLTYFGFPLDTLGDQFHWTEITVYYDRPESLSFETNHIDASRPASFSVNLAGRLGTTHIDWVQIRNGTGPFIAVMDSVQWFGRGLLTTTVTLPPGTLGEGNVNRFRMWGKNNVGPPNRTTNFFDNVALNYFETTYWRSYRALNTYLACNSGDAEGEIQIHATGFLNSAPRVYDVTDSLNPVRLTVDPAQVQPDGPEFAVDFQDSVAAGSPHRYVAFSFPKSVPPAAITPVTRRQLGSRTSGDYLLIVPEAFLPQAGPLVALRASQGLDVVVAPLQSVYDEFNGGRRSSYAIKRFVRHAYENWDARWVLLFGDGSEDPQNLLRESSTDWIPVQKISGPVGIQFGYEIVPSDPWYVCLNNSDLGGSTPVIPDLFIGRLPVQTPQQARDVVAKIVAYEDLSPAQPWRNTLLLSADDDYSGISFFGGGGGGGAGTDQCRRPEERVFRQINETVASIVTDQAGLKRTSVEKFYLADVLGKVACLDPQDTACTCRDLPAVRQITRGSASFQLRSALGAGCLWWNFQGHANEFVLTHEDLYLNEGSQDDTNLLANDLKPYLFSAFSCHANAFAHAADLTPQRGPSLGEDMVMLPRRGAIASWASTGYEILPSSGGSHINVSLARALFLDPPHDEYFGGRGARVVLGEAIALALARYVPGVVFNPNEKGIALTYNLLGDPATRISIGAAQAIVTANGDTVISDRPVALAPPRDTLHLEADLVSNVQIDRIVLIESGSGGVRTIPDTSYTLTPAFPDTAASGRGGRRYHLSFTTPVRPGILRYTLHTEDRYGLASDFNLVFQFFTQLRVSGNALAENDAVAPAADLSLKLVLPTPITDPQTQLALEVDSLKQAFTATALETTGREWLLRWTHDPYAGGTHLVELTVLDSLHRSHHFRVVDGLAAGNRLLRDVVAFPNPFDEQLGTTFSFYLLADGPADVMLRLFTVGGRAIYQRQERGLPPGYHQWAWDGRDAEGDKLANGVYLYRVVSTTGTRSDALDGRLVKLRRPRGGDTPPP